MFCLGLWTLLLLIAISEVSSTHQHIVGFTVRFNEDNEKDGLVFATGEILKFDNVVSVVGNGYNVSTGIFTAPTKGLYVFSLTAMTSNTGDAASLAIMMGGTVGGTELVRTFGAGRNDTTDQNTKTVVTYLYQGTEVWVAHAAGGGVRGSYWTTFSGFLVEAGDM